MCTVFTQEEHLSNRGVGSNPSIWGNSGIGTTHEAYGSNYTLVNWCERRNPKHALIEARSIENDEAPSSSDSRSKRTVEEPKLTTQVDKNGKMANASYWIWKSLPKSMCIMKFTSRQANRISQVLFSERQLRRRSSWNLDDILGPALAGSAFSK
ncbi:uncharacterized protein FOMMEDRAFT_158403 [Fomitiporia mediterranea MF3/22]|uniref:uncharacterized protein n=1 Tax=Fomitiporia mediterranea (strain MF3/22) TaxID=694068 RepID=UPI00044099CD|nr:uncharacterized protein FOMMEDRAFT_158403 [Fomitiporia mediterranea MF3/22]EJD01273.1 hypothetical protein FOMMEDRAFT_158403 [Fomitiporia mediterranea MF3/22]